jgi:nitronate monooxygenase
MAVVQAFLPEVVSFHFGLPSEHFVQAIKALGIKIISSATTLQEALYLQTHGADAIIAQGVEAGGHRAIFLNQDLNSQLPTLTLLKQLVSRLSIPIIAAGGVGDARDVQTALAAGASAVQIGSAFLLSQEATTSAVHRAALLRAQQALHNAAYTLAPYAASDLPYTALTNLFSGRPARGLMNRFMREMGAMHADAPAFPYASAAIAALRTASEQQGLDDFTPLWCGQNLLAPKALPAAAIMDQLLAR